MLTQEKMKSLVLGLQSEGYAPEEIMRLQNMAIGAHKAADAAAFVLSDELLAGSARISKRHFDALVSVGFTPDQAIQICAHAPYRVASPPQMTSVQTS
jgi:ABC-type iron transport system FetAB permease component